MSSFRRKIYKVFHPILGEIWMLHRVVEHPSDITGQRELEVTPDWLEQTILAYQNKGYIFISLDEVLQRLEGNNNRFITSLLCGSKKKFVCITFDDGYHDNYTLAYPLLKRNNIPFAIYVTTGFIDNRQPMWWYPGEQLGMARVELLTIANDPLCTIGAHTVSHPKLDTLTQAQQYQEIAESKQTLEALLGHEVQHFSFPHGAHDSNTISICQKLGFKTIAKSWGGQLRHGEHFLPLPRIEIKQQS